MARRGITLFQFDDLLRYFRGNQLGIGEGFVDQGSLQAFFAVAAKDTVDRALGTAAAFGCRRCMMGL
jgi:hypothetical protein